MSNKTQPTNELPKAHVIFDEFSQFTSEQLDAVKAKAKINNMNCDCGGLLHETTSLSSTEKRAYCPSCNTQYFASNSDMLEGDTEWLPVVEQPKDYALYYSMKNFDFSGLQYSDVKCEKCPLSHSVELIYDMAKTQGYCECIHCGHDIGYQIAKNTSKRNQEATPIVEVHYEYCHGIYVVLALLIGGLIGFIFGVGR